MNLDDEAPVGGTEASQEQPGSNSDGDGTDLSVAQGRLLVDATPLDVRSCPRRSTDVRERP